MQVGPAKINILLRFGLKMLGKKTSSQYFFYDRNIWLFQPSFVMSKETLNSFQIFFLVLESMHLLFMHYSAQPI